MTSELWIQTCLYPALGAATAHVLITSGELIVTSSLIRVLNIAFLLLQGANFDPMIETLATAKNKVPSDHYKMQIQNPKQ